MRVLLLTEGYPPEPIVGALRAGNVARALARAGHRVTVVTAGAGGHTAGTTFRDGTIEVHVVRALPGVKASLSRVQRVLFPASGSTVPRLEAVDVMPQAPRRGVLHAVADLLSVPDDNQGWIPVALRHALRIGREGIDLLYSTSPSHSTQVAALLAATSLGCPWVAEFRDPWTDNGMLIERQRAGIAEGFDAFLERLVVRRADLVVAVSHSSGELFARKRGTADHSRVRVVLNGIERLLRERPPRRPGPFRLVYSGSMYYPRDPVPLLAAFARVVERQDDPWEVRFIGDCRRYEDVDIEETCQALGLRASFRDWVPPDEARAEVEQGDLLLLPAQRWIHQIPNKLFDYLGARTPILALCERGSEPARLLERAGGQYVIYTDAPQEGERVIRSAIEAATSRVNLGNEAYLRSLTVAEQMKSLVAEVERCVSRHRAG